MAVTTRNEQLPLPMPDGTPVQPLSVRPRMGKGGYHVPSFAQTMREAWDNRRLFWLFGLFSVKRMFFMTLLGPAWLLIHAAIDIGGKTFLFGNVLQVKTPGRAPYVIFLLTGLLGWMLFQETVTFGVKSFQRYRRYVHAFDFPLVIVPISAGAQALVQFTIYLSVVVASFAYYAAHGQIYFEHGFRLAYFPLGLLLCLLFGWGLSFILGPLNFRARDVRLVMRYVLQFWVYVTPVVYPLDNLHGTVLLIAKLNPLAPMVEMMKYGLIGGGSIGPQFVIWGVCAGVGTFVVGLVFINRYGRAFVDAPSFDIVDGEDEEDDL